MVENCTAGLAALYARSFGRAMAGGVCTACHEAFERWAVEAE